MLSYVKKTLPDGSDLLYAAFVWVVSALVLLVLAALAANAFAAGERGLAYISSAVSFLAAAAAGSAMARRCAFHSLLSVLLGAAVLVILLLTAGFLIGGEEMNPSSVISLVSFTFAGMLFGFYAIPKKGKTSAKRRNMR